jgi:hypothetical protein
MRRSVRSRTLIEHCVRSHVQLPSLPELVEVLDEPMHCYSHPEVVRWLSMISAEAPPVSTVKGFCKSSDGNTVVD